MPFPPDLTPRLSIRNLRRTFGDRVVLEGVSLDLPTGTTVVLAGSNGSGKTTLLRCVAGLARHDGDVLIDGAPAGAGPEARQAVGYLPQAVGLPEWATGAEILDLFATLRSSTLDELVLPDGFLPPLDEPVRCLSGGQRQRIAIATAFLGAPTLLLLDEPAANLDGQGRAHLHELLDDFRSRGGTVLLTAPSPDDVGGIADHTVRLVDGRLVGDAVCAPPAPPTVGATLRLQEVTP